MFGTLPSPPSTRRPRCPSTPIGSTDFRTHPSGNRSVQGIPSPSAITLPCTTRHSRMASRPSSADVAGGGSSFETAWSRSKQADVGNLAQIVSSVRTTSRSWAIRSWRTEIPAQPAAISSEFGLATSMSFRWGSRVHRGCRWSGRARGQSIRTAPRITGDKLIARDIREAANRGTVTLSRHRSGWPHGMVEGTGEVTVSWPPADVRG